jgi:hypothetical protein
MLSSAGVPDDERKARRLGDETKGRIADLASGWTVEGDTSSVPERPIQRDASGPASVARDTPRRKAKTLPPPAPGSAARKALEDKIIELRDVLDEPDDPPPEPGTTPPPSSRPPGPLSSPPSGRAPAASRSPGSPGRLPEPPAATPAPRSPGPPGSPPRPRSGQVPLAGKPRAPRTEDPLDLSTIPEADKTKENRGAVGVKRNNSSSGSHTANAASGTIGEDTPPPIFDRAAIAAGQKGALATERVGAGSPTSAQSLNALRTAGTGQTPAVRGTPRPGAFGDDRAPLVERPPARSAAPAPPPVIVEDGLEDGLADDLDDGLDGLDGLDDLDDLDDLDAPDDGLEDRPSMRAEVERAGPAGAAGGPRRTVPLGEFDESQVTVAQDKRRPAHPQATSKRDAASALPGQAEPAQATGKPPPARALPVVRNDALPDAVIEETSGPQRDDATFEDAKRSSSGGFDRGDPTIGDDRGDATALSTPGLGHAPAGTLRNTAALPRKRGIAGDMRYVATVVFGVRAAKRELAELATRQATRQQSRRHHLVTLGRTAVALPDWINAGPQAGKAGSAPEPAGAEHPALGPAREQLAGVEGERSQHAGHIIAADAELTRVRLDREAKAKQYLTDLAALDAELASIAKRLEPLDKEASGIKKRAADLRDALRQCDGKIASAEASLTSGKADKLDRAAVQAEIASLKADRKAILRDEPVIAEKLDALNPRIAGLEAARGEAHRKRAELETAEQDDQRRAEELLTAIGAKRKVVDRAAADAEALRDKILFQLGERLYVDRPDHLTGQLAPLDEIDVELGIADRRTMELREVVSTIDKRKIARGVALIVVLLGAVGALIGGVVYLVL